MNTARPFHYTNHKTVFVVPQSLNNIIVTLTVDIDSIIVFWSFYLHVCTVNNTKTLWDTVRIKELLYYISDLSFSMRKSNVFGAKVVGYSTANMSQHNRNTRL